MEWDGLCCRGAMEDERGLWDCAESDEVDLLRL